ncbi:GNAT family N-acetyltransferase [Catenovulum sp. SM1970]|uniref:GNAT family N-acetyltransferase n=1 Tax=Marinifaba aquimaris TaxID=2741323 RepID=UPI001572EA89|nr:GNAT family N-acetyltransferase [Marinifaba aquimaris]NTS77841.1 GNAT family N-acetyltransferase [Marinifaba aquimaris]
MLEKQLTWQIKPFSELSTSSLYALLKLRQNVFMLEQNSLYADIDDQDQTSQHLLVWQSEQLIGYARVMFNKTYCIDTTQIEVNVIGRFVLAPCARGQGVAKHLFKQAIGLCLANSSKKPIKISAQSNLAAYYRHFGFETTGEVYDDGGVEHIDMLLKVAS